MATKHERMMAQIEKHAQDLARIFPNAKKQGVDLCKALHRLETQAHRYAEDLCNVPDAQNDAQNDSQNDSRHDNILGKVRELLGDGPGIIFNLDPRGYAFKISTEDARKWDIHRDWGGYGIICPEFDGN